uniref:PKD and MgtE_N domain protein n=1 Tax=uncultured marine crenarchaeote E6-3G TaxID=907719 RepID=G9BAK1_9ARCH|nr:PKD and MgtE_N domain protein [uncultured marine crenarchaeote E6-3G]
MSDEQAEVVISINSKKLIAICFIALLAFISIGSYVIALLNFDSDFQEFGIGRAAGYVWPPPPTPPNWTPIADAGPDVTTDVGVNVTFDGSSSSDPDGTITDYSWSFGDGSSATGVTVYHVYGSDGTYTVTLTVTDNRAGTDSDTATVTVGAAPLEDIEDMTPEEAAAALEGMTAEDAADELEGVSVETAADIVEEMAGESAASALAAVDPSTAVEILEDVAEEEVGDILDGAVQTGNTETFSSFLLEMEEDTAAGALLETTPVHGADLVEAMAETDLTSAASTVEAAVKLIALELEPAAQEALLERVADMLEDVTVDTLVDLFIEIANLPATPETVATVMEAMDLPVVLEVVTTWVSTGELEDLAEVFGYLTEETLTDIWTGMTASDRAAVYTHLSAETIALLPTVVLPDRPVVVAQIKGALEADTALKAIIEDIDYINWIVLTGDLTADDLDDAAMLISVLSDKAQSYSEAEVTAINDWLDEGGKTIWLAGDSDYGSDYLRIDTQNALLEDIGSVLRVEHCAAEDPVSNGGASYRVISVTDNIAEEFEFLAVGVDRALTHSPGVLTAYTGGRYWELAEEQPSDVYVLLTTSEAGQIYDHNPPEPESVEVGDEGSFVTMAVEVDWAKDNMVILEGEAPFGSYMPMYYPEMIRDDRYGAAANPQQGGIFFTNIINYATTFSSPMFDLEATVTSLTDTVSDLTATVDGLTGDVATLESQVDDLEDEKSSLESDVSDLESSVGSLESQVSTLESDLAAARSSANTMQMYAIAALVIGLVVGVFVGPMIRKS